MASSWFFILQLIATASLKKTLPVAVSMSVENKHNTFVEIGCASLLRSEKKVMALSSL